MDKKSKDLELLDVLALFLFQGAVFLRVSAAAAVIFYSAAIKSSLPLYSPHDIVILREFIHFSTVFRR